MIYLAQVVCPAEHALLVVPWRFGVPEPPQRDLEELSRVVADLVIKALRTGGAMELQFLDNTTVRVELGPPLQPWCPICGARDISWTVQVDPTHFATLEQAHAFAAARLHAQKELAAQVAQLRRRAALN